MVVANTNRPSHNPLPRILLAFSALLFLVAGAIVSVLPDMDNTSRKYAAGTLLKVGVVLGLGWLAAPQLERFGWNRLRGSLLGGIIVVLVLYSIRPRLGALAGAVLVVGALVFGLAGWLRAQANQPRR